MLDRSKLQPLRTPILWGCLGALLLGGSGAGYGTWLYYSPESREAYIQKKLAEPHFDSLRYIAGILAWRYRTLGSLICQYAIPSAVAGLSLGIILGKVREEIRQPEPTDGSRQTPPFSLLELLAVLAIIAFLVATLASPNYGLVYHQGQDQFYWLQQLEFGEEPQQREAVTALTALLGKPPFPCRSTIIPALAKQGELAEPAIPLLEQLAQDEEPPVREAAQKALVEIRQHLENHFPMSEFN